MPITGTIEQAPKDQYYMTDSMSGDIMFRSLCNINWLFGFGSNVSSLLKVNVAQTTINTPTSIISGTLGVKTFNPQYDVDINGNINFTGTLTQNGEIYHKSPWESNSSNIYFTTGLVGIGKNVPVYNLDVVGITATDTLYTSNIRAYGTGISNILNVGTDSNTGIINIGGQSTTINLSGNVAMLSTTELFVEDKKITLNNGGVVASGSDTGIEIQENNVITGYIKTSADRNSFVFRTPTGTNDMSLNLSGGKVNINSNSLVIDGSSNVGIGTSPSYRLDVEGDSRLNKLFVTSQGGNSVWVGNSAFTGSMSNSHALYQGSSGDTTVNAASGQQVTMRVGNTEYARLSSTGNFGIGTASPSQKLDVNGTMIVRNGNTSGTSNNVAILFGFSSNTTYRHSIITRHNSTLDGGNTIDVYTWKPSQSSTEGGSNHVATFSTVGLGVKNKDPLYDLDVTGIANVSDKVYVTNSIGLGTTSTSEKLHISGGNIALVHAGAYGAFGGAVPDKWMSIGDKSLSTAPLYQMSNYGIAMIWDTDACFFGLRDYGTNRKDTVISFGDDAASENLLFMTKSNAEIMRLTGTGSLGIGVAPWQALHVSGSVFPTSAYIAPIGSASAPTYTFSNDTNTGMSAPTADTLVLSTTGTDRLRIGSTGNVGIGNIDAWQTLHVSGSIFPSTSYIAPIGTADAPTYTFSNDTNTGIWSAGGDILSFSTGGTERLRMQNTEITFRSAVNVIQYQSASWISNGICFTPQDAISASNAWGMLQFPDDSQERVAGGTGEWLIGRGSLYSERRLSVLIPAYSSYSSTGTIPSIQFLSQGDSNLLTIQSTGNIGVGTSAPWQKLHVTGSIFPSSTYIAPSGTTSLPSYTFSNDPNTGISAPSADTLTMSTAGAERARIDSAGNIGIGTSNATSRLTVSAAGTKKLQFENDSTTNRHIVLWELNNNEHQFYGLGVNSGMLRYQIDSTNANHIWYAGTSTTASTELMRLTGTGNLGVGGIVPWQKLHVSGSIFPTSTYIAPIGTTTTPTYTFSNDTNTGISAPVADTLAFITNGTEKVRVDASGSVGIGKTPDSNNYKLDVNGTINATAINVGGSPLSSHIGGGFTASATSITYTTCNVGISTTSPSFGLDVNSNARVSGAFRVSQNAENQLTIEGDGSVSTSLLCRKVGGAVIGNDTPVGKIQMGGYVNADQASCDIRFFTMSNGSSSNDLLERMVLTKSGTLGIGTSIPNESHKLDVNGTINATNITTQSNALYPTSNAAFFSSNNLFNKAGGTITGNVFFNNGLLTHSNTHSLGLSSSIILTHTPGIGQNLSPSYINEAFIKCTTSNGTRNLLSSVYNDIQTVRIINTGDAIFSGNVTATNITALSNTASWSSNNLISINGGTMSNSNVVLNVNRELTIGTDVINPVMVLRANARSNVSNGFGASLGFGVSRSNGLIENGIDRFSSYIASYLVAGANTAADTYGLQFVNRNDDVYVTAMTILPDGKVGIGKTNPAQALDVNGTITATSITSTNITAISDTATWSSNALLQKAGDTMTGALTVNGLTTLCNLLIKRATRVAFNNSTDSNHILYMNADNIDGEGAFAGIKWNTNNGLWIRTGWANDGSNNPPLTAMFINSNRVAIAKSNANYELDVNGTMNGTALYISSNVGIGTTTPTCDLTVKSTQGSIEIGTLSNLSTSTDAGIRFNGNSATMKSGIFTEVDGRILSCSINMAQIQSDYDSNICGGTFRFDTRTGTYDNSSFIVFARPAACNTESPGLVVGLTSGHTYLSPIRGNVIVGSTVTPWQKLHVSGSIFPSTSYIAPIGTTTTPTYTFSNDTNTGISAPVADTLAFITNGTEKVRIDNTGSVGIGKTPDSNNYKLDINGALNATSINVGGAPLTTNVGGGFTAAATSITYTSCNVGIGSTSPTVPLDVVGEIKTTSQVTAPTVKLGAIIPATSTIDIGCDLTTSNVNIGCANTVQVVNIGANNGSTTINIGTGTDIVNIAGTMNYVSTTDLEVTDKLITLNKGGALASGGGTGIQLEESNIMTGYIKTSSDRNSWLFKTPTGSTDFTLDLSAANVANLNASTIVMSNTNVGIGTNPLAGTKLDVFASNGSNARFSNGATNLQITTGMRFGTAATGWTTLDPNGTSANGIAVYDGFAVGAGMTVGNAATYGQTTPPTNGMLIEGNVGIGNTAPWQRLHVTGSIYPTSTYIAPLGTAALPSITFSNDTNTGISAATADQLVFSTAGTDRLRIGATGQVSIGNIAAWQNLHVSGNIFPTTSYIAPIGTTTTPTYTFSNDTNTGIAAPVADTLALITNGTEKLRVDASGSVGIGTTPDSNLYKLDVQGNQRIYGQLMMPTLQMGRTLNFNKIIPVNSTVWYKLATVSESQSKGAFYIVGSVVYRSGFHQFEITTTKDGANTGINSIIKYTNPQTDLSFWSAFDFVFLNDNVGYSHLYLKAAPVTAPMGVCLDIICTTKNLNYAQNVSFYDDTSFTLAFASTMTPTTDTSLVDVAPSQWVISTDAATDWITVDDNGDFGIGIADPWQKLHVDGSIYPTSTYIAPIGTTTSPTYTFSNDTNTGIAAPAADTMTCITGGAERMRINASGNVGIGTSNATSRLTVSATGTKKLQFENDLTTNRHIVLWEQTNNEHQYYGFGVNASILRYQVDISTANHVWYAGATSTTSTELMRLTGTGNLGVGGIVPWQRLHVSGSIYPTSTYITPLGTAALPSITFSNDLNTGMWSPAADSIALSTGGTERLRVENTLIALRTGVQVTHTQSLSWSSNGICFAPQDAIVAGNAWGMLQFPDDGQERVTGGTGEWLIGRGSVYSERRLSVMIPAYSAYSSTGTVPSVQFLSQGDSNLLTIQTTGNVGIGTNAPTNKLHVVGTIKATGAIDTDTQFLGQVADTVTTPSFAFTGDLTTGMYHPSSGNIGFTISGTQQLNLSSTGLSVGSNAAAEKLDVQGNVVIGVSGISPNYIRFAGTSGDVNGFHSVIGERIYAGVEQSELFIGKFNDAGTTNPGPDRIRMVAANHVFQVYNTATSNNTFEGIAGTTFTDAMLIGSTGNIGMGVTSPWQRLHVSGSIFASSTYIAPAGTAASPSFTFSNDTNTGMSAQSADTLVLSTAGVDRLRIGSTGLVGIGNIAAWQALHVAGSMFPTTSYIAPIGTITTPTYTFSNDTNTGISAPVADTIAFITNGTEKVRIDSIGEVGIGTNAPTSLLHIYNSNTAQNADVRIGTPNGTFTLFTEGATNRFNISDNTSNMLSITGSKVGIKNTSPSYDLHVNGVIAASSDMVISSDLRLKENLEVISSSLEKIKTLSGYTFTMKNSTSGERKTGLVAQEVEKVLPEVVREDENGFKSVAYGNIAGLIIESIKSLDKKIDYLYDALNIALPSIS
jgi:Chaperone of endosialidase